MPTTHSIYPTWFHAICIRQSRSCAGPRARSPPSPRLTSCDSDTFAARYPCNALVEVGLDALHVGDPLRFLFSFFFALSPQSATKSSFCPIQSQWGVCGPTCTTPCMLQTGGAGHRVKINYGV